MTQTRAAISSVVVQRKVLPRAMPNTTNPTQRRSPIAPVMSAHRNRPQTPMPETRRTPPKTIGVTSIPLPSGPGIGNTIRSTSPVRSLTRNSPLRGVIEKLATGYGNASAASVFVYGALLLMLLVRPYGLFGEPEIRRV